VSPLRGTLASLRRRPVRVRLAIFSAALTAVILIGFALVVGRLVSDRLQGDFNDEVASTAKALALNLQAETNATGVTTIRGGPNLDEFAGASDAVIRIVDVNGDPLPGSNPIDLGEPSASGGLREVGDLVVSDSQIPTFITTFATPALYVQYARDPSSTDKTIARLWLFLGCGVVVGTILAGVAGMSVARRAMRPIASLTGTARTIARTRDPSLRIPEPENEDEVAELARTLDEMLRELDAARTEAETTVRRQREFVADASHELRTPLTSILANLELLEEGLDEAGDEDELAATRSALRSSKRMSRLVGDLLILARADAGRRGEPVECDLSRIASEAFEEVEPVAEEHEMRADLDPGVTVMGDPDELHRMVLNLLENAIRHTPDGTSVELGLHRNGERMLLEVADDGPGLPAGAESKLFGRFVRGTGPADSQGRNGDGTGLGLAIVKAVAIAHGGEASAGPSEAGGARFAVTLPLAPEAADLTDTAAVPDGAKDGTED